SLTVPDSIAIAVSCIGYRDTVIYCSSQDQSLFFSITMRINYHTLLGVVVNSPPVWRRGDTTFFNVNSFAEGTERKLKDILEKMPGFEISVDGKLRYNRKIINKIMIDGEELFSDRIALLLNNFPVHVLKNIQAIENQSDNKLLKGLSGDGNMVLNLGLNDNKQKALFGDGEAGVGTAKKYSISPVLFSLIGKVKGGYIGNWNNIGNGIGWQQLSEIKNESEQHAENWMRNNFSAQTLPDFENRWYINNAQKDNRLQLNYPIGKNLKSKTEINYYKDAQRQNSFSASSFYNGSSFYLRNDSNTITNEPSLLKIRETITWSMGATREMIFINEFYNDLTSGSQNTVYNQNGALSYLNNSLANNWQSFSSRVQFTHRIAANKASQSFAEWNHQKQVQSGIGLSPNWPAIYSLSNDQYNSQFQNTNNSMSSINAGTNQLYKKNNCATELGLNFGSQKAALQDAVFVNNETRTLTDVAPIDINNKGNYIINKLGGALKKSYSFSKQKSISINISAGLSKVAIKENNNNNNFITPEYAAKFMYQNPTKSLLPFFDLAYSHSQAAPYQLFSYLKPSSVSYYIKNENIQQPLKSLTASIFRHLAISKNNYNGNLSINFTQNFSSFAYISSVKNFVDFTKDSIVNIPTYNFNIATLQQIPSLLLNSVIDINAGFIKSSNLIANKGQLFTGYATIINVSFGIRKNWNKKYYVNLKSALSYSNNKYPSSITGFISPKILNFKNSLTQRIKINKDMYLLNSISIFSNNLFTKQKASFPFVDLEYYYKIKNSPLAFTLRGENLSDTKYFYRNFDSFISQSFYHVPLIQRRVFISCKYDL
ncbi:MAG: hypothetical protein ABIP30_02550, partial [Ferruginibacter sp.]